VELIVCEKCGGLTDFEHNHRADNTGLDDGPWLPGCAPRKKPEPKPPHVVRNTKLRGWVTRRAKYGTKGHR